MLAREPSLSYHPSCFHQGKAPDVDAYATQCIFSALSFLWPAALMDCGLFPDGWEGVYFSSSMYVCTYVRAVHMNSWCWRPRLVCAPTARVGAAFLPRYCHHASSWCGANDSAGGLLWFLANVFCVQTLTLVISMSRLSDRKSWHYTC